MAIDHSGKHTFDKHYAIMKRMIYQDLKLDSHGKYSLQNTQKSI